MPSPTKCKVCNHRAIDEINRLLLTDRTANDTPVTLGYIVQRMNKAYPDQKITISGLSRHKSGHLLSQPLAVQNEDGQIEFFGTQQRDSQVAPTKDEINLQLDPKGIFEYVLGQGLADIRAGRMTISRDMFTKMAIEFLKVYGKDVTDDTDVTKEAWEALHRVRKVTVTKTASVSETVEQLESPEIPVLPIVGNFIEGESEIMYAESSESDSTAGNA